MDGFIDWNINKLGVFPTNYRQKVLFTKKVRLRISELPRWKPKTIINLKKFDEKGGLS